MPLAEAGEKLGPYEILFLIGKGGMGEVYRAHDPRMGRDVAVKVSAEQFTERFSREVHAVAALNHPNICQLYDVGPNYLVMELVEGTTLAELIKEGGPIPFEEALRIARQIAEALEEAHEKGIVHRDLKPGNIKITPDGTVKVLDFGLAKMAGTPTAGKTEDSPTMTMSPTQAGMILGTAAYMSPEQARGKPVDKRADIWAFGVVLYEMLTGKQAFTGETITDVLAAVVKTEPEWNAVPEKAQRLLRRCLEKDPERRLRDVGDFELLLEQAAPHPSNTKLPWVVAGALALIATVALWGLWRVTRPADRTLKPLVRLDVDLGPNVSLDSYYGANVMLSPDGSRIAYVSRNRLFTRRLDESTATELAGTEGASEPFFSPDGQWLAFFAVGKLKKISVEGGTPLVLCGAALPFGGSWSEDGSIIASFASFGGLLRVPSAGGEPVPFTELDREKGEVTHRWPQILPGDKAVLFTAHTTSFGGFDDAKIDLASLLDHHRKTLIRGGSFGRYLPSGHLIYISRGTLYAVSFDLERLELHGAPVPVLEHVSYSNRSGSARFDFTGIVNGPGTLVYQKGGTSEGTLVTLQWLDDAGGMQPLLAKAGFYLFPRLSPDGQQIAMAKTEESNYNIWVYNSRRDAMTRLTFDSGYDASPPLWTPDGRYILFNNRGFGGMFWTRSDGAGKPQPLTHSKNPQAPWSFSPDGKRLAYVNNVASAGYNLFTVSIEEEAGSLRAGKPEPFSQSSFDERHPSFSPDGHWMAYASNESGTFEVYVRAFPDKGGKWQVSNAGGAYPLWSRARHQLFFRTLDNRIMVAEYKVTGDSFVVDRPRLWSARPLANFGPVGTSNYDLAPDGKRIVALMPAEGPEAQQHHVIFLENFYHELRRRVPTNR